MTSDTDNVHSTPHSDQTTFTPDMSHTDSQQTTFITDHVHDRPRS